MTADISKTRVPRMARRLAAFATAEPDRAFVLADLDDEYARLRGEAGSWRARTWYWRQAIAAVRPGLGRRLSLRRARAAGAERRRAPWLTSLGSDLRFASRRLRQSPVLLVVTAASLGLGIGATTSVFSVANGLLLRQSAAIQNPEDVLSIYTVTQEEPYFGQTSIPDFVTVSEALQSVDSTAAFRLGAVSLGDAAANRTAMVEIVTSRFFDVLGVTPSLGRFFGEDEGRLGDARHVTVVSDDFWRSEFGGAPDVLGREIRLDGQTFTIIGVAPPGFRSRLAEMHLAAWVPAGLPGGFYHATDREIRNREAREYGVLARRQPGVADGQIDAELSRLGTSLHDEYGTAWEDASGRALAFRMVPGNPGVLPPEFTLALRAAAALVLVFAIVILLVACSNVAGLLLAQAHERRQEMAVRAALGAGRRRLVRMLLVESAMLALVGGIVGVLVARIAIGSIGSVPLPFGAPLEFDFGLDGRVLFFALGVSVLACLAFGLLPALAGSRTDLVPALKMGRRGAAGATHVRLRRLLVVTQVAVTLILLAGAGLVLRATTAALEADPGFTADRIAVVSRDLSFDGYSAADASVVFDALAAKIAAYPDVESVALATGVEQVFDDLTIAGVRPDTVPPGDDAVRVRLNAVGPHYMSLLDLAAVRGRTIGERDVAGADRVAVVNETFAARHWPGQPAVGRTMRLESLESTGGIERGLNDVLTVVGVIRDPHLPGAASGRESGLAPVYAKVWVPLAQHPSARVVIHARARGTAASIVPILRAETGIEDVPLVAAQPLEQLIALPLAVPRAVGRVMRWGGAFTLVLSVLGIYGIVSFTVAARSREMAIRKAMGARTDQIVRRILQQGMTLAFIGVAIGLGITVPLAMAVRSELTTMRPLDPVAVGLGSGIILLAALVASAIPARRLVRLDPMAVLRDE